MYIRCFFFLLLLIHSSWLLAQAPGPSFFDLSNSMIDIGTEDSVFISIESSQKFIQHRVKKGETFYSIKKFYGIETSDLYYSNPGLEGTGLRVHQVLRIPMVGRAVLRDRGRDFVDSLYARVYYRVRPKETLWRIAKVYFTMPVEALQQRNQLKSAAVNSGQILHVGWMYRGGIPDSLRRYTGLTGVLAEENNRLRKQYEASLMNDKEEVEDEGRACWPKYQQLKYDDSLYVLHSKTKSGAVVRIENPMTQRVVYAKVIGQVPDTPFARGAVVMLSPTVAQALGALDASTYVKLNYLK